MNRVLHYLTMAVLMVITFSILFRPEQAEESFTYFPADKKASFQSAATTLSLLQKKDAQYLLYWKTNSLLDRKAYLRQDISLLYANGVLIGKIGKTWKQHVAQITWTQKIAHQESANFKSISFHHAELHENSHITSVQSITKNELYVVDSNFSPLYSFQKAVTADEKEWKSVLDKLTYEVINASIENAIKTYSINKEQYSFYLLTDLAPFTHKPFPGFSSQDSSAVIGRLWEGIYKNYFLGIRKKDGTYGEPFGSTIPVILVAKDKSHLIVISELQNGEIMLLRQVIQNQ